MNSIKLDKEAEQFLKFVRERTGLLNEQGQDCYAFVHKTFQEYLCAQDINYQADNEDEFEIVLNHVREHLHDQHWREVLLLLIVQQKPKKAAKAIRTVLERGSQYEQWLYRDLLFAGRCLGEDPKDLKVTDLQLIEEVLSRLAKLEIGTKDQTGKCVRENAFQIVCNLHDSSFETHTLQLLESKAKYLEKERLQIYRATLGQEEDAIRKLTQLLQDKDDTVRYRVICELETCEEIASRMIPTLQTQLANEDNDDVYWKIAFLLPRLGNASEQVIQANLALLKGEKGKGRFSFDALPKLANASEKLRKELLNLLKDDNNEYMSFFICHGAKTALSKLSNAPDSILDELSTLLTSQNLTVRLYTAKILINFNDFLNAAKQVFSDLLNTEDPRIRLEAAEELLRSTDTPQRAIQVLLLEAKSDNELQRCLACLALSEVKDLPESELVLNTAISMHKHENHFIRYRIATTLGNLGIATEPVIHALLHLLNDNDHTVRTQATQAMVKLNKNNRNSKHVELTIVKWLEENQNSEYLGAGVDALWKIVEE